ncbi:tryptophan halogenase family protein [Shewanella waksmanii]|uniref:tryptophan halogenase family protein n=1 Tax=Shewanella waksmanii TaxID=213783 RepID=UPI0004906E45|nr:tryptophan halogenase family protein [Shewanella waksmanii]
MSMTTQVPRSILIVGGGTAGWMAATSLLAAWGDNTKITLVESEDIGIIGVGEGSTPYLKQYFSHLGIEEKEWMTACDATYKAGITFPNWSTVKGYESYFHPFFSQFDLKPAEMFFHNCGLRRRGHEADVHPENYFVASQLVQLKHSPITNQSLPFDIDYGYHFDSGKLGSFLKQRAKQLGLHHVIDHVAEVITNQQGEVDRVQCKKSGALTADLYIDCTGFSSLLLDKALKVPFQSFSRSLFNNAAIAIPSEAIPLDKITPHTVSTALTNGWAWEIPLTSRVGNGYVYSDAFQSADSAELELRQKLNLVDADVNAKHLKMKVGRVENHWHKNCLGVGLSQGFIEPLEATALMLIQFTLEKFIARVNAKLDQAKQQQQYNDEINATFDGVKDYIVAHYKLNSRSDSDYWHACREDSIISDTLAELIHTWDSGADFEQVLTKYKQELVYLRPSWYCILAGMGRFPENAAPTNIAGPTAQALAYCEKMANQYFVNHEKQLTKIHR